MAGESSEMGGYRRASEREGQDALFRLKTAQLSAITTARSHALGGDEDGPIAPLRRNAGPEGRRSMPR